MGNRAIYAALATVGIAAPFVAQAESANVVIYGKLYPQIVQVRTSGATDAGGRVSTLSNAAKGDEIRSHTEINASNSRLGFRGTEDLGNGYKAHFQIEQKVAIDTGEGELGTRNTFVGLSGGFGFVKLGNYDTVYKSIGDTLSFLGISGGNFVSNSSILSKSALGSGKAGSFHLRAANTVRYESPEFGGLQFLAQYATDEAKTDERDPDLQSYGVKYRNGPLYLALAHEIHTDFFGGSRNARSSASNFTAAPGANSRDTGTRATVQYKFGNSRVEVDYAVLKYKESGGVATGFKEYEQRAYSISADHKIGNWTIAASYAHASPEDCSLVGGGACSTSGLDGEQLNLGASYSLSKRTSLFALFSRLNNDRSARFSNLAIGKPDAGADITQAALGISHSF
ncbi:porin [Aromatoleum toluclasticum]|uniref:porin n=1 Tax=Aromatoleum toluclasticum TaxID=92003 RepID=UPI0003665EAB|nr:porin [Aromatoleum toluclasticum]